MFSVIDDLDLRGPRATRVELAQSPSPDYIKPQQTIHTLLVVSSLLNAFGLITRTTAHITCLNKLVFSLEYSLRRKHVSHVDHGDEPGHPGARPP